MRDSGSDQTNGSSHYSEDEGEEKERDSRKSIKGGEEIITVTTRSDEQGSGMLICNKEDSLGLEPSLKMISDEKCSEDVGSQKNKPSLDQNPSLDVDREIAYKQGNWLVSEILILLEAKAKEEESCNGESKKNRVLADDKWKNVSAYCKGKGVNRSKEQCRIKWDNMMPDFRKIRDYEEQKEGCVQSYFEMEGWERRAKILPSNMDIEVYQRIANILSNKPPLPPSKGGLSGLKRETREKRISTNSLSSPPPPPLHLVHAVDVPSMVGLEHVNLPLAEHVGKLDIATSRKRRRKTIIDNNNNNNNNENENERVVRVSGNDMPFTTLFAQADGTVASKPEPEIQADNQTNLKDDSSTEDDTTVMSSRSRSQQRGHHMSPRLFAERTCFPASQTNDDENYAFFSKHSQHQRMRPENPHYGASPPPPPTHPLACRNDGLDDKGPHRNGHDDPGGVKPNDVVAFVEDRKDARHRDMIALEREKLVVFKEASYTIANAMTNAVAMFSKVAEELLFRHH